MSETRVFAKVVAKPDQKQKLKRLLSDMIAPSLAEPGVLTYDLHEATNENGFYLFEIYDSQESFDRHKASPHFQHLIAIIPDLLAEPVQIVEVTQIK